MNHELKSMLREIFHETEAQNPGNSTEWLLEMTVNIAMCRTREDVDCGDVAEALAEEACGN